MTLSDRDAESLCQLGACEQQNLIETGEISTVECLTAHWRRIDRINPSINALVTFDRERSLETATRQDQKRLRHEPLGRLAGLAVGIKDITETAGLRTTYGSPSRADHIPEHDAEVVARIRRADGIVIGKTNTPEYAAGAHTVNRVFGVTRNPWDFTLSASGSTGGGAAGLAAGLFSLAEGSDFGGSLRTPAAFCGVTGLRTTPGLVPLWPADAPWFEQSVGGPMARNTLDLALLTDAMTGLCRKTPQSRPTPWHQLHPLIAETRTIGNARVAAGRSPADAMAGWLLPEEERRNLRIGWIDDLGGLGIDPSIREVCLQALRKLMGRGAQIEPCSLDTRGVRDAFVSLRAQAMLSTHQRRLDQLEHFNPLLRGNIEAGFKVTGEAIALAETRRRRLWLDYLERFDRFDLLLTPTVPVPPFPVETAYPSHVAGKPLENYIDWIATTFTVSIVGLPAASVPAGLDARGLPVGLQIIGPQFSEPTILQCAQLVELDVKLGEPAAIQQLSMRSS